MNDSIDTKVIIIGNKKNTIKKYIDQNVEKKILRPPQITNFSKVEKETEQFRHKKLDPKISLAIQKARQSKNLTQTELAKLLNFKVQIINDYEKGNIIPNSLILSKLNNILNYKSLIEN